MGRIEIEQLRALPATYPRASRCEESSQLRRNLGPARWGKPCFNAANDEVREDPYAAVLNGGRSFNWRPELATASANSSRGSPHRG